MKAARRLVCLRAGHTCHWGRCTRCGAPWTGRWWRYRLMLHWPDRAAQKTMIGGWRRGRLQRIADRHNACRYNYSTAVVEVVGMVGMVGMVEGGP